MFTLENELLRVTVSTKGAELQSITGKAFGIEYLWNGNPAFWAKKSPILFPIVGSLKNNSYSYQGKSYTLPRHGFARDMDFQVEKQSLKDITFLLKSNSETKTNYPFDFEFRIKYQLQADELSTEYQISNTGNGVLLFSVGGHPAFNLPLTAGTEFSDYYLKFDETEN
ncbi:MAG: aldose 1-epimerase family protein, partial [Bacteroidota bacterium]|nr:aldose 1-epimerase family protein [Bacteroidota bacterium]